MEPETLQVDAAVAAFLISEGGLDGVERTVGGSFSDLEPTEGRELDLQDSAGAGRTLQEGQSMEGNEFTKLTTTTGNLYLDEKDLKNPSFALRFLLSSRLRT